MTDHEAQLPDGAGRWEASYTDDETAQLPTLGGAMTAVGMMVGERYRLRRRIATDAAGNEFWQARDTVLSRDMAITILPATEPTSATVTRTLRVGRLGHPGLPQTLDMGAIGTNAYLAGLWVDGATISELLGDGPLEAAIAQRVIASVAEAVQAVHQAGIALGALHPSLVRVNFEGQVRLSHVISSAGAVAEDDARAVGGLLYFMLTGVWPLDAGDGPAGATLAPRRGDRPVSAHRVAGGVPAALAKLADRALNPQGAHGLENLDELAALGGPAAPAGETGLDGAILTREVSAGQRTRRPRRQRVSATAAIVPSRVMRDRRIKLSIAGAMLTALAVLIVITGSSVVKQMLAEVVEPINAADQQRLISAPVATTTRSVGTTDDNAADTSSDDTGQDVSDESPTSAAPAPVKISEVTVYDPQGDGSKDYESYVDLLYDGDTATEWLTWVYQQQFGPGGIKDGVGVTVKLAKSVTPATVTVTSTTPGTQIEIRSASGADTPLTETEVLGSATLGTDPVSITLDDAPKSKFFIVWITKLAEYRADGSTDRHEFQSRISEISVTT